MDNNIRKIRKSSGITLERLAELVGTNAAMIQKLEVGERGLTLDWMRRISEALGCAPEDLITSDLKNRPSGSDFDDKLLMQCVGVVEIAASRKGGQYSNSELTAFAVSIYKYVMKYRSLGDEAEPNTALADLALDGKLNAG